MRFLTAGESHGPGLSAIIEGLPSRVSLSAEQINNQLARRQRGYGRGGRMRIETDCVEILSGVRFGQTLGSPVALLVRNRDWANWSERMAIEAGGDPGSELHNPRPGHADLSGALKYDHSDVRNVLERASARETAMRVAVGAVARAILNQVMIQVRSHVVRIGEATFHPGDDCNWEEYLLAVDESDVSCGDPQTAQAMRAQVDAARAAGDSVGGTIEVRVTGLPIGLGSHVHWDRRLDSRLSAALIGIQAMKGVEFGDGFELAARLGSCAHDEILTGEQGLRRATNRAGGLEGGMTNGEPLVIRVAMKPIPTLMQPLRSVELDTWQATSASTERSDVCAVPAAAVVCEAAVCWEIAQAVLEKFGGDSLEQLQDNMAAYANRLKARGLT